MRRPLLREYVEAVIVAVILALFTRTFLFENFKIPSASMEGELLVGDHLLVNKLAYAAGSLPEPLTGLVPQRPVNRGDVVVFRYPADPRRDFIKRCVAVAGDTVEIRRKRLLVNGREVDEPYAHHDDRTVYPDERWVPEPQRRRDNFGPYEVPPDAIFCLGDNRDASSDSRFWGPVPLDHVEGRAVLVYWSVEPGPHPEDRPGGFLERTRAVAARTANLGSHTRWERTFALVR